MKKILLLILLITQSYNLSAQTHTIKNEKELSKYISSINQQYDLIIREQKPTADIKTYLLSTYKYLYIDNKRVSDINRINAEMAIQAYCASAHDEKYDAELIRYNLNKIDSLGSVCYTHSAIVCACFLLQEFGNSDRALSPECLHMATLAMKMHHYLYPGNKTKTGEIIEFLYYSITDDDKQPIEFLEEKSSRFKSMFGDYSQEYINVLRTMQFKYSEIGQYDKVDSVLCLLQTENLKNSQGNKNDEYYKFEFDRIRNAVDWDENKLIQQLEQRFLSSFPLYHEQYSMALAYFIVHNDRYGRFKESAEEMLKLMDYLSDNESAPLPGSMILPDLFENPFLSNHRERYVAILEHRTKKSDLNALATLLDFISIEDQDHQNSIILDLDSIVLKESDKFISQNSIIISNIYRKLGYTKNGLDVLKRNLSYTANALGEGSEYYAYAQIGLANYYKECGDYYSAIDVFNDCRESVHYSSLCSFVDNGLSLCYSMLSDYDNAIKYMEKTMDIHNPQDERIMTLSFIVGNLLKAIETQRSSYYNEKINQTYIELAKRYVEELINLASTIMGDHHIAVCRYKLHQLKLLSDSGEVDTLKVYSKRLEKEILQTNIDEKERDKVLRELSYYYTVFKDYQKALLLYNSNDSTNNKGWSVLPRIYMGLGDKEQAQNISQQKTTELLNDLFSFSLSLTNADRERFWNADFETFKDPFRYADNEEMSSYVGFLYDIELNCKSFLLTSENLIQNIVLESNDSTATSLFNRIKNIRSIVLNSRSLDSEEKEQMQRTADYLEKQLLRLDFDIPDSILYQPTHWQDIITAMPDRSICVEITEFRDMKNVIQYGALLLRKDWKNPMFIIIGDRNKINENLSSSKFVYKNVLDFLKPYLNGIDKAFIAPSGMFHNIPFESICKIDGTSQIDLYRVSSTNILLRKKEHFLHSATLYGGIEYDASIEQTREDASKLQYLHERSLRPALNNVPFLEGTLNEVVEINHIMSGNKGINCLSITGGSATEASLRSFSGKKNNLLHIATHGVLGKGMQSALLFAGAQNTINEEEGIATENDGIVTAAEMADLDFRGLDLVTLSACETAKGDITGDGVFGLQRGFKKAGAHSVLMSLWKVDDEATCKLMTEFYSNWIAKKMTKHDALEAAKKTVRETKGWEDPKYWAAFILLDGLD